MHQVSSPVLSSTSWSEAPGENLDRGVPGLGRNVFYDQGFNAWPNIAGSNKERSDNIPEIIWGN